jgi:hypothetical protein
MGRCGDPRYVEGSAKVLRQALAHMLKGQRAGYHDSNKGSHRAIVHEIQRLERGQVMCFRGLKVIMQNKVGVLLSEL